MKSKATSEKKKQDKYPIDPEKYEYVSIPPDGGYGWVIAIAAMLCNLVCDGTLFAFGSMKIYLQKHFECSDMLILMVGSVPCGVYLFVGPIVSGLANLYGCRTIIIIGSIGAAVMMVLSTFSPNVWVMMVLYGVIGGIFFGMIYLPSVVMVSFYFDKKRAIANGIVTAGTGMGVLSFGPLANFLMNSFGWKIGMYVFAGLMLSCILFGAIMKPLEPTMVLIQKTDEQLVENKLNISVTSPSQPVTLQDADMPLLEKKTSGPDAAPSSPHIATPGSAHKRRQSTASHQSISTTDGHHVGAANPEDAARPLYQKGALFTGSIQHLRRASRVSLNSPQYLSSTVVNEKEVKVNAFADIMAAMTDFSILKNKKMLLICIGNIFSMLGYYLPIMCLVSFAIDDMKVNRATAPFLMTIFGICNTIGRFTGGPIAMIPGLNPLRVHNATLYLSGVLTVLASFAYSFASAALYAGLCGFLIAPHMSLMPNIVHDCVGLDKLTNALGILFLFRGATSIVGPPAAGFIKDYTQNYDVAFTVGGAMIIIAAFFHFAVGMFDDDVDQEVQA